MTTHVFSAWAKKLTLCLSPKHYLGGCSISLEFSKKKLCKYPTRLD